VAALISKKKYPHIYEFNGYWLDIGRPSDYEKAIEEFSEEIFL
jgi:NDP-sugar pyrophosphorylase family protein